MKVRLSHPDHDLMLGQILMNTIPSSGKTISQRHLGSANLLLQVSSEYLTSSLDFLCSNTDSLPQI